jgi:hypothetical protein
MNNNHQQERRALVNLSDEQMDMIAERAAEHALAKVYEEVGKSIVKKLFWVVGAGALGLVYVLGTVKFKWPF